MMISRSFSASWTGVNLPRRARESKLLALFAPIFRSAPLPPDVLVLDDDECGAQGWTAELRRGGDLPRLRLSILDQPGAGMALRFDACAASALETRGERC
ncbi:hypothetical protein SAMN06265338_10758 [Rhodoblastus acidophilus]|uniref:Uncharacterized protein n=2 Tax=Rhodoblastus acidophilus TaxID=1074 RepID=A0A212RTR8_RHOAC|nr:hypothetical protein CKO16_14720 [Rhodoblastus acidophilus]RAI23191.1 hypothetical protein CH337_03995 [Rhodoblastus acidophilus]SNB75903.1 hypothetical protein SAMN06265338_10758 [Rhodoblastus acidophilus]